MPSIWVLVELMSLRTSSDVTNRLVYKEQAKQTKNPMAQRCLRLLVGLMSMRTSSDVTYRLAYEERAKQAKNPMAQRCLELMARKQSNLSVAADVDTVEETLDLAEKVCDVVHVLLKHTIHIYM